MKKVYVIDGVVGQKQLTSMPKQPIYSTANYIEKPYRYFLFIVEQSKVLDDNYFLLGFGIGTNANRKYMTKRSIVILIYFLTKLLIMEEKVYHNIHYTVDIGNLNNSDIIKSIKIKHELKNIRKECVFELEDELIDDFLYYYFNYGKKK